MNIDLVRRLAIANDTAVAQELIAKTSARFGGLAHLKSLPDLIRSDSAEAAARYYMLPVMMTVRVAPPGLTVASLLANRQVQDAWARRRQMPPGAVSVEQWHLDHDAALLALAQCRQAPVVMLCEIQLVLRSISEIRHAMHDVYKVIRAKNGKQLYADVAPRRAADPAVSSLYDAAALGMVETVTRLVAATPAEIDKRAETRRGETPMWIAAYNGNLSVVLALLAGGADPSLARADNGATPVYTAAENGHLEVVRALVDAGAEPNTSRTDKCMSALWTAARCGHHDVLKLLLDAGGVLTKARAGETHALMAAAENGHADAVRVLLDAGADPRAKRLKDDATPLYAAAERGHLVAVTVLLDANGGECNDVVMQHTNSGSSALSIAAQKGYIDLAKLLSVASVTSQQLSGTHSAARSELGPKTSTQRPAAVPVHGAESAAYPEAGAGVGAGVGGSAVQRGGSDGGVGVGVGRDGGNGDGGDDAVNGTGETESGTGEGRLAAARGGGGRNAVANASAPEPQAQTQPLAKGTTVGGGSVGIGCSDESTRGGGGSDGVDCAVQPCSAASSPPAQDPGASSTLLSPPVRRMRRLNSNSSSSSQLHNFDLPPAFF